MTWSITGSAGVPLLRSLRQHFVSGSVAGSTGAPRYRTFLLHLVAGRLVVAGRLARYTLCKCSRRRSTDCDGGKCDKYQLHLVLPLWRPANQLAKAGAVPEGVLGRGLLLLEDFGARAGCAWMETNEADTDRSPVCASRSGEWLSSASDSQIGLSVARLSEMRST